MYRIIVCTDMGGGIGKDGKIPWYIKEDLEHFKQTTLNSIVVMGRKTYESIGKPLSSRINIVFSNKFQTTDNGVLFVNQVEEVMKIVKKEKKDCYVIGGEEIYNLFLSYGLINEIIETYITNRSFKCDKYFFAPVDYRVSDVKELSPEILIRTYHYRNKVEQNYLDTVKDIFQNGIVKFNERTGETTRSGFCKTFTFDLSSGHLPVISSRKIFIRGAIEETLFFLSGSTDVCKLQEKGIIFWNKNTDRTFLDSRGLTNFEEYDMGSTYGFLYRHFGAEYRGKSHDYTGLGYDQVSEVIKRIKETPNDRRHMINIWDPNSHKTASLPPCMFLEYFYVREKFIDMFVCIRSSDMFHGLPFNFINASIILILIAYYTGYTPGKVIITTLDTHIYSSQFEAVKRLLEKEPINQFPRYTFNPKGKDIFHVSYDDFEIFNYHFRDDIKTEMVV